jgi:mRNA-degrading endonuclease RelE of RelBE toxin-antitoxin system
VVFTVLLHPKAAKELERIESPARSRITDRLKESRSNPETIGKTLKHSDFLSLRIGDFRAIYEIHRAEKQVIVLFIGHRKKVYDDFSKLL